MRFRKRYRHLTPAVCCVSPMAPTRTKMHQTTVRFGADLWAQLEREAASTGVSAAQYVREATLSRLTYSAAQRGEGFGAGAASASAAARADAAERQSDSSAVWAQARLARERARSVRKAARATQAAAAGVGAVPPQHSLDEPAALAGRKA